MLKRHLSLRSLEKVIDFASNDYLGLARSPDLFDRFLQELQSPLEQKRKMGSTGSRLLTGNSSYAMQIEEEMAAFHGAGSALLFPSGYMANLALLSSRNEKEKILFDSHIHASTRQGIALSKAAASPFRHGDLNDLEKKLKKRASSCEGVFVCVESIDSTDGTFAPLKELFALTSCYEAHLIVDEAHAVGVLGPQGKGLVAKEKLEKSLFCSVVTFGKALGIQGGALLISKETKEELINQAYPFIYTTAPSFYMLAAIRASYSLFPDMEKERSHLQQLVETIKGKSHIQIKLVPGNEEVMAEASRLYEKGIAVSALRSPTVRRGKERLRISLHAFNTQEEIKKLKEALWI